MQFRNPATGYTESKSAPALWTAIFGGLYFIANGLWSPFLIWVVCAIASFAALGEAGIVLTVIVSVCFAVAAPGLIRSSYLRRGWIEVEENDNVTGNVRQCPACAETVKTEAVICRFCKTALEPVAKATPPAMSKDESLLLYMDEHGITYDGTSYYMKGMKYATLTAAVDATAPAK